MKEITTVGVDLAKSVFTVHGVGAAGRTALHKMVRRAAMVVAEDLPVLAREAIADSHAHLSHLDERITRYEPQLVELARQREAAICIQRLPGVGPLAASAITASISDGHEFADGRQFAVRLGLVPRQYSTQGKPRLGRSTKRGDAYLRTRLMLGARVVLQSAALWWPERPNDALVARPVRDLQSVLPAISNNTCERGSP